MPDVYYNPGAVADDRAPDAGAAGTAALWMFVAGLAFTAGSLLF